MFSDEFYLHNATYYTPAKLAENGPLVPRRIAWRREQSSIPILCSVLAIRTLPLLLANVPPHPLYNARPDVEQDRDHQAEEHEKHRLTEFVNFCVVAVAPHRAVEVVLGPEVAFALPIGIAAVSCPL